MRELMLRQRQLVTYLAGGVLSALIDVGLMQGMLWLGMPLVASVSAGFLAGLLFNFMFHAHVTFQQGPSGATLLRYLVVVGLNYLLTLACVALSVHLTGMALPGKLLSLGVVAANGFTLGKRWVFK
jgi:putative flippase GtrA